MSQHVAQRRAPQERRGPMEVGFNESLFGSPCLGPREDFTHSPGRMPSRLPGLIVNLNVDAHSPAMWDRGPRAHGQTPSTGSPRGHLTGAAPAPSLALSLREARPKHTLRKGLLAQRGRVRTPARPPRSGTKQEGCVPPSGSGPAQDQPEGAGDGLGVRGGGKGTVTYPPLAPLIPHPLQSKPPARHSPSGACHPCAQSGGGRGWGVSDRRRLWLGEVVRLCVRPGKS